jgi:putative heme iron utilization protein
MRQNDDQPSRAARQLLSSALHGVLSTHSLEHPGYPFGSVGPYALDQQGLPVFLLSHLSQHTRNLGQDPRCGLTLLEPGPGDVQQRGRLSAVGDVEAADPSTVAARFLRYYPQARMYFEELGFRFYRFRPLRFHWNGGFATARWFGANRILRANPFSADQEAAIVAHMNRDHPAALRRYLDGSGAGPLSDDAVSLVGIDAEGMDLRQGDRLYRVVLAQEIHDPGQARTVLSAMARERPA